MRAVASFVRELPSTDNLDVVGAQVFNSNSDGRVTRFKQAVNYFLNGTRDHYGRHKSATLSNRLSNLTAILYICFSINVFFLSDCPETSSNCLLFSRYFTVRQHNHHGDAKSSKQVNSTQGQTKVRQLASEAADAVNNLIMDGVRLLFAMTV